MTKPKPKTRGEKVIAFIQKHCVVPEGKLMGKPVKLIPFQTKFILDVYDNPHITDTAILSIARKNAKTALIAFIVLAHLVGPEAVENSRLVSGAMSKEQAAEVFNLASKCVKLSPTLNPLIRIVPSGKKLIGLRMNTEYQATSADAKTAHGKSPIVAILDEVGQIKGPQSDFVDAITTAQGAYENPLLIYISTQAATDGDLFSIQIDDALNNKPPKTVCHLYCADKDADIMDEEQWRKANPALGIFRSEADMRKQADKAFRMPSFSNTFRNLNLNQRVSTASPFINRNTWDGCKGDRPPLSECIKIVGGIDLSSKTDLTAFALQGYHPPTKTYAIYVWFWTPEEGLIDRSKKDRAPYDKWVDMGFIETTPGLTVNYAFVAKKILEIIQSLPNGVEAIGFDRWKIGQLKEKFSDLDVEEGDINFVEVGQGFKDMSIALDGLENKFLNKLFRHGDNPVLAMCAANAAVVSDPTNNRKLDKLKSTGRIDGLQALAIAEFCAEKPDEEQDDMDSFLNAPLVC